MGDVLVHFTSVRSAQIQTQNTTPSVDLDPKDFGKKLDFKSNNASVERGKSQVDATRGELNLRGSSRSKAVAVVVSPPYQPLPRVGNPIRPTDEKVLAMATLQHLQFQLEKSLERLVEESDGGSRVIPEFREHIATFENCLSVLC